MDTIPQKRCPKCGQSKPLSEFGKDTRQKSGLTCWCKDCRREADRAYNATHKKAHRARSYRSRDKHPERRKASLKQTHAKHYEIHREEIISRAVAYRKAHPETAIASSHTQRARKRGIEGTFTGAEWVTVKAAQNYRCLHCGKSEPEISLTVDHIVSFANGGSNWISNVQALCLRCNRLKH